MANMMIYNRKLTFTILFPLSATLVILVSFFIFFYSQLKADHTDEYVKNSFLSAQYVFKSAVRTSTEKLSATLTVLSQNESLKRAMIAGDRATLLHQAIPIFEDLRKKYNITHFYFINTNRSVFLRVHQPQQYGDEIVRFTAKKSQTTGKLTSGLELGPLGTFTLRTVIPWRDNNRLIGYLELGEEVGSIMSSIHQDTGLDFFVTIKKNYLSQKNWAQGLVILNRKSEWNYLSNSVLIYHTMQSLSTEIRKIIATEVITNHVNSTISYREEFYSTHMPLTDAGGREVGNILLVRDVTALNEKNRHSLMLLGGIAIGLCVLLLYFYYQLTKRVESRFTSLQTNIEKIALKHRLMFESSRDSMMTLAPPFWKFNEANHSTIKLFGVSNETEFLAIEPWNISPKLQSNGHPSNEMGLEMIEIAMREGSNFFEWTHQRFDGQHFDADVLLTRMTVGDEIFLQATVRDITKRKQFESALAESEERFKLIMETIDEVIWISDTSISHIYYINQAYERIFGRTCQSLYDNSYSIIDAIHPEDKERLLLEFDAKKNRQLIDNEYRVLRPDGSIRWVVYRSFPISDKANKIANYLGIIRDITEQKYKINSERIKTEKLQFLFDNSHHALLMLAPPSWKFTGANSTALKLFGVLTAAEFESLYPFDISPEYQPDGRPSSEKFLEMIEKAMNDGVQLFEWVHKRQVGDQFYCDVQLTRVEIGNEVYLQATIRDITKRKQIDADLQVAAIAFESQEGMFITDSNIVILRVNKAFTEITGYTSKEAIGKTPHLLKSDIHDAAFYTAMWDNITNIGTWNGEIWNRRKNGEVYLEQITITAVKGDLEKTTHYVATMHDITRHKEAEEEVKKFAFYDTLTKLPNRRLLLDRFDQALSASTRSNRYGAILYVDLDRFKMINDKLGHDQGDLLLIEASRRILTCVREIDTVSRIGGDEFVVLIENISTDNDETMQNSAVIAEKIRASLAVPYLLINTVPYITSSIGVNLYRSNEESAETLLKHADIAMYQAKNFGGNAIRFYDYEMQLAVEWRIAFEDDLRCAISDNQLHLYYQIQVDNDNRPIGAEALLRWIHPRRGLVSPADFIHIAEKNMYILEIGEWVLNAACNQISAWSHNEQTRDLVIAVNISAKQFEQPDFVEQINALIQSHNILSSCLKLELTESISINDIDFVVAKMLALRHVVGVTLSLDDFGTGYSSLSILQKLPIHQIKIDQSFVRDMLTNKNITVLVKTIINMARNFGLHVIAEGVETDAQHSSLKENGCMAYQGYLFSKPVPIYEFDKLLKRGVGNT